MRAYTRGSLLIMGLGGVLFSVAVFHHATELSALDSSLGPVLAVLLDGIPALAIVGTGFYLSRTDFDADDHWLIGLWCVAGAVLFAGVISATVLVRIFEDRTITEPLFSLLVATETGGIAGIVAGFYNSRARADARRAHRVTGGLRVVNNAIRHDLRNDLNTIQTYAELMESEADETEYTAVIRRKTEEAAERIDDLGALGKTVTEEADLQTVDLVSIVENIVSNTEDAFGVTIGTDLPDTAPVVANQALQSVVDNLVENAAEHTDADDPQIAVEIEADEETVRLFVRDNGPGIPDGEKRTVFDYRPDSTGGGGLFLVKTLVSEYDGDVWVEDNDPRGSTFVVELQRAERS